MPKKIVKMTKVVAKRRTRAVEVMPKGYAELLAVLKERIRAAQLRAALAVNHELVALYWHIGKEIIERQGKQGWGTKVVDRIANDLHREFPGMGGLSERNLNNALLRRCIPRAFNFATACCKIAVGSHRTAAHQGEEGRASPVVRTGHHRQWLEPCGAQCASGHACASPPRQGRHQLQAHAARRAFGPGAADLEGPLHLRVPQHRSRYARARSGTGHRGSYPKGAAGTRRGFRLRRQAGATEGGSQGLLP
ncbi:MAG: hypothetical protein JNM62_05940 [Flavobacteriales bacterium]|nr:hypothetical protein [Flavobacteriales bacterium]